MSGITSGVGIFSGIDRTSIIKQLLAIEGRPKQLVQQRIIQIQTLQTSLLDINTRLGALKTVAGKFNLNRVFESASASSSNSDVLSASATPGASPGSYSFLVDRLVTTQQVLTRGFADSNTTALGATSFSFEPAAGRLDSSTRLSSLNGGAGITRGKIQITDASGTVTQVDLSRVETVSDVVEQINAALGSRGTAGIDGDRLQVIGNADGLGSLTITDAPGTSGTTASLGLNVAASGIGAGEGIFGNQIHRLGAGTALRSLNDGLGVFVSKLAGTGATPDFQIKTRDGSTPIDIDIGDIYDAQGVRTATAVSDLGGVIARINSQSDGKVTASIDAAGTGLRLVDNTSGGGTFEVLEVTSGSVIGTTAADLGIKGAVGGGGGTVNGSRLIATLNSTLARNVDGGSGLGSGEFSATARDGTVLNFNLSANQSIDQLISEFGSLAGGKLTLELGTNGRGFILRDISGGSGPLTVSGAAAEALGVAAAAVAGSTVNGASAQHKFIGSATLLSTLNAGRGVGTGTFRLIDSYGVSRNITIPASATTIGDVIGVINSSQGSSNVRARVNDTGDGLLLEEVERPEGHGAREISIVDTTGSVARLLGIAKTASGIEDNNFINGSFERVVTFAATDTLDQVVSKINQAGVDVQAAVIADGASAAPFRLSLTSRSSGDAGRFTLDSGGLELGLTTLAEGSNARVFFGSSDPARAILLSSTTNTFAGLASGLSIEARSASSSPVTVSVATDNTAIETAVDEFVKAFNDVAQRISTLSSYDATTQRRGALLGESTTQLVRSELTTTILSRATGVSSSYQTLIDVGFGFDRTGALSVDKAKLRQAIAEDPLGVRDLFAARVQGESTTTQQVLDNVPGITVNVNISGQYSSLGIAEKLAQVADRYIKPVDGILTRRNLTLDTQIRSQNARVASLDARLESRRQTLERQFVAMESAIGRLQTQQGSLGAIQFISR